jgi:hypothetical protein
VDTLKNLKNTSLLFILITLSFISQVKAQENKQYECALRVDNYPTVSIEGRLILDIGDTVNYQDDVAPNTILNATLSILPSTHSTEPNMLDIVFKVAPYDELTKKMKSDLIVMIQTINKNQIQTQLQLTDSHQVDYYLSCKKN